MKTNNLTSVKASIDIDVPKDKVWAILADFGNIAVFNPNLKGSFSTSEDSEGVGATRHCDLTPIGAIEERVLNWKDGEEMLVAIYDGKNMPPLDF